jgi:flagellar export protein FliJ
MARFVYRLQKVYELRERKKKEQEQRVQEAQAAVRAAEARLQANLQEQAGVIEQMRISPPMMLEMGDRFLQRLREKHVELRQEKEVAQQKLKEEEDLLKIRHQELEALEKHKERCLEEWKEEEKAIEMKMLDEIGSQRYFRNQQEAKMDAILAGEELDD